MKNKFSKYFYFMKPKIIQYATGAVLGTLVYASLDVIIALTLKNIINATLSKNMSLVISWGMVILTGIIVMIVLAPVLQWVYNSSTMIMARNVRNHIFHHLVRLPLEYFELRHSGDIMSRLTNDANLLTVYTQTGSED
jgi:ATP-binding cassette, subfamily B, bacterial